MKEQKNRLTNERDFRQDTNYKPQDPEKAKMILQLGTMITDRYLQKYTHTLKTDDPEYWALDAVLTKEEVKFLLNFKKTSDMFRAEEQVPVCQYNYDCRYGNKSCFYDLCLRSHGDLLLHNV